MNKTSKVLAFTLAGTVFLGAGLAMAAHQTLNSAPVVAQITYQPLPSPTAAVLAAEPVVAASTATPTPSPIPVATITPTSTPLPSPSNLPTIKPIVEATPSPTPLPAVVATATPTPTPTPATTTATSGTLVITTPTNSPCSTPHMSPGGEWYILNCMGLSSISNISIQGIDNPSFYTEVASDEAGHTTIDLAPGRYHVTELTALSGRNIDTSPTISPSYSEADVTIVAGQTTSISLAFRSN